MKKHLKIWMSLIIPLPKIIIAIPLLNTSWPVLHTFKDGVVIWHVTRGQFVSDCLLLVPQGWEPVRRGSTMCCLSLLLLNFILRRLISSPRLLLSNSFYYLAHTFHFLEENTCCTNSSALHPGSLWAFDEWVHYKQMPPSTPGVVEIVSSVLDLMTRSYGTNELNEIFENSFAKPVAHATSLPPAQPLRWETT